jgi:hypothetical protein
MRANNKKPRAPPTPTFVKQLHAADWGVTTSSALPARATASQGSRQPCRRPPDASCCPQSRASK